MGPSGPHFYQFLKACSDCFWSVFDVGVPNMIGRDSGHLELVILDDVYSHKASIVGVVFLGRSSVVHVRFKNVQ